MAISATGDVIRTGSAGTGGLGITADGGLGIPLPAGASDLVLVGEATGVARVQLGGAAGHSVAQDIQYTGFNAVIEEDLFQPGEFDEMLQGQPYSDDAVAVKAVLTFHLNNVGDTIDIPATVGLGSWRTGDDKDDDDDDDDDEEEEQEEEEEEDDGEESEEEPLVFKWYWIILILLLVIILGWLMRRSKSQRGEE